MQPLARGRVKRLARYYLPLLVILIVSCSKDDPSGPNTPTGPPQPPPTGDITQTIQPSGGAITATSAQGAIVTLTFPAGAVGSPLSVSVKPRTPESGTWANIVIEPKDVVFLQAIQVALKIPNGVDIDTSHQIFMGSKAAPMLLPTTLDVPARTLHATTWAFGASAADDVGVVARSATADVGNNISARAIGCQEHIQMAQQAIDNMVATGTFENALAAASAAASIAARTDCADAAEWVTTTAQLACDSLAQALTGGSASSYGDFRQSVAPILYWAAIARALDPGCSAIGQVASAINGLTSEFMSFAQTELGTLVADDMDLFNNLKDEARDAHKIFSEALAMGETATATQLQDESLFPLLIAFRDRFYNLCGTDRWHYALSRLTSVGFYADRDQAGVPAPNNPVLTESVIYGPFTDADIWDDLQLCATDLSATTRVTSGGVLDQQGAGGGSGPGDKSGAIVIRTPSRGELTLSGSIAGFTCWDDIAHDNQLSFEVNNFPVLTRNRSADEYLASPAVFDMQNLAAQAGIALSDGQRITMHVKRMGSACDDRLWGESGAEVIAVEMDIEGPGLVINAPLPATVLPGEVIDLTIQVEVTDQLGTATFEPGVHIDVSAIGGSASPPSGATDATGTFQTQITVAQALAVAALSRVSGAADLLVSVTALLDGVVENELLSATIQGGCDVDGFVTLNSQEDVDAEAGTCSISRALTIQEDGSGSPITDLTPLASLTFVGEGISIVNTSLTTVDGLQNVSLGAGASFAAQNNDNLVNLDSLATRAGSPANRMGIIWFQDNAALTSIDGVQNLMQGNTKTSFVTISGNPMLISIAGLADVDTVDQALSIVDNDALTSLNGLDGVVSTPVLTISGNATLASISSLGTAAVTDALTVEDNAALTNLDGLESVVSLAGLLEIINNAELADIDGLANLASVGNALTIEGNAKLCTVPAWVANLNPPSKVVQNNGTDPSCSPVN